MNKNKKIVLFFSRLSDYMLNTLKIYVESSDNSITVFKTNPDLDEAPFEFNLKNSRIDFFDKEIFSKEELLDKVLSIKPDLILCSGWANSKYNYVVKEVHNKVQCILTMDNQWHGTLRQCLGLIYSRINLINKFKKIWVPGLPQVDYAKKLGFKEENIIEGWYVANKENFIKENIKKINKKFVFVGRYIEIKGIRELCNAFIEINNEKQTDWELYCIGAGSLMSSLPKHDKIHHLGFMQPEELKLFSNDTGVFVLPSHFEPWGVVVQEFALAGFPLIVSNKVGAASKFVDERNGVVFESGNINSLKKALVSFTKKDEDSLLKMSSESVVKALKVNEESWTNKLNSFLT